MKTLIVCVIFLLAYFSAQSQIVITKEADIAAGAITPAGIQQPKDYDLSIRIFNYGPETINTLTIDWCIVDKLNPNAKTNRTAKIDLKDPLPKNESVIVKFGNVYLDTAKKYLVIAEVSHNNKIPLIKFEDKRNGNNKFYQQIGGKNTDIGIFIIDSPSPKNTGTGDFYVSIINYGLDTLESCYVKWLWQDEKQATLINEKDTTPEQVIEKWGKWEYDFHVFNKPVPPGQIRQVQCSNLSGGREKILLAATYHPNGFDDYAADDTSRAWLSHNLWGKYSIGNDKDNKSQFGSINEAIDFLYKKGMQAYDPDHPVTGQSGVQFYVRPGTYKGSVNLDGNFPNQNAFNGFSLQSFQGDSTRYIIQSDGGKDYCLRFNNIQHFAIRGFDLQLNTDGNVIRAENNVNNFVVGSCRMNGTITNSTDPAYAVVRNTGAIDSCNFSMSSIKHGSYGVYLTGSAEKLMKIVGTSDNYFKNQANCAVSIQYAEKPFIARNRIYNNRIEFLNCVTPFAGDNRIYTDAENPSVTGRAYYSEPYSLAGFFDCSGEVIFVHNNLCVKSNNYYGVHIKNCQNHTSQFSVVNNSSIQSNKYGVFIDNSNNILINLTSIDLTSGKSQDRAGVYVNESSDSIRFVNSIFSSYGGGYAVLFGTNHDLCFEMRNNYYTKGDAFARAMDKGDYSDLNTWHKTLNISTPNMSSYMDPIFNDDCDLTGENPNMQKIGYEPNKKAVLAPMAVFPDNHTDLPNSVNISWTEVNDTLEYWLQVSKAVSFPEHTALFSGLAGDEYDNLVLDQSRINTPSLTVNGLEYNTDYYWRVQVNSFAVRSDWSQTYHFKTGNMPDNVIELSKENDRVVISRNYSDSESDRIYLLAENISENLYIEVFDFSGNRVKSGIYQPETEKTDVSPLFIDLGNGLYFIRINTADSTCSRKILISR